MRVTGGIGKGRRLKVPTGSRVRPTADKVKQALFNILGSRVVNSAFLDLYAGAGGIGIEALSRGAGRAIFVDVSKESCAIIQQNIECLGYRDRAQVVRSHAMTFLKKPSEKYDLVFLDPPYAEAVRPLLEMIAASQIVKPDGIVIMEHFKKQASPKKADGLSLVREAHYGDTVLAFYALSETRDQD